MERDLRLEAYMMMRLARTDGPVKDDVLYRIASEGEAAIKEIERILTEREERRNKE